MNEIILLVEDNPDDEALAIRALQKNKISNRIVVARDGAEALDMLFGQNGHEPLRPTVILMDLKLPKLDGIETLKCIRDDERTRHIPVVMLTTSDQESDILRSYEMGVNSYVRKPIDFAEFIKVTSQLGMYWLLVNTSAKQRIPEKV
ncbi:MAG: response regulator [Rhodomicrobium sp.]|nr:response regulator [Rhodomicrobium sp.]